MIGRLGGAAVACFIVSAVLWYVGAGDAYLATLDSRPLAAIPAFALLFGAVAYKTRRRRESGTIAFVTIGMAIGAFFGWTVVSGTNVWLDRSAAEPIEAEVLDVRGESRSRNPPEIVVLLDGAKASFPASLAPACKEGQRVVLHVRRGALGGRWVERARCNPGSAVKR
jgi:hypothetical protein